MALMSVGGLFRSDGPLLTGLQTVAWPVAAQRAAHPPLGRIEVRQHVVRRVMTVKPFKTDRSGSVASARFDSETDHPRQGLRINQSRSGRLIRPRKSAVGMREERAACGPV